jgi:serine/threonine protein kinase
MADDDVRNPIAGTEGEFQERVQGLFDDLLESNDAIGLLDKEPDLAVRQTVSRLWSHHLAAGREEFLEKPVTFKISPVFEAGQLLLNRFEVRGSLGHGGMGEVYLAFDRKLAETVALKTISRGLASFDSIRLRFIAEVQSARLVTHPNVCRIHELFEDGEIVFFSMECVEGVLLSDWIASAAFTKRASTDLARQLAEGLHAAHCKGVVHGDFKPSNVVIVPGDQLRAVIMDFGLARVLSKGAIPIAAQCSLQAGTPEYMAPELSTGSSPSIQSDIYAFGKVGQMLLPGLSIWDGCARQDLGHRLASLEPVIAYFGRDTTRRFWIGGMLFASTGAVGYAVLSRKHISPEIEAGARLLVNGFQSATENFPQAKFVRSLLLNALQQSPRLHPISDEDLLPMIRSVTPGGGLPLTGDRLRQLLAIEHARYWIDGALSQRNGRASFAVSLLRTSDSQILAQTAFADAPAVSVLAVQAAVWIRRMAGESDKSLSANPSSVPTYTSSVPEALQKYYEGMERYSVGNMSDAVPFFEEAVRLDERFAQAHNVVAMCLQSQHMYAEAYQHADKAMQLSAGLPKREKCWIEASYHALVEDPVLAISAAKENVNLYPDEPRFYRIVGQQLGRIGATEDAISWIGKAIELAPQNELYQDVLAEAKCEVNKFEDALRIYENARSQGNRNPWIETGHGLALLGLERYEEAEVCFRQVPPAGNPVMLIQGARILAGEVEGAIAELRQLAVRTHVENNSANEHQANEFLCGAYYLLDNPKLSTSHLEEMLSLPVYPPFARQWQCTASWAGRLLHDEALNTAASRSSEIAGRWPNGLTRAVAKHAEALVAFRRRSFDRAEQLFLESLGSAFTVWTTFDLATFYLALSRLELAAEYWQKLEDRRGVILRRWFTGTVLLTWLNQAVTARHRGDYEAARRWAKKVLEPWGIRNPHTRTAQAARAIVT